MRKMCYLVFAVMALLTMGVLVIGCQSCHRATKAVNGPKNSNGVPVVIADAKLLSYKYSLYSTMRWPLHSESVEICKDDSTRCIIRLFDDSRIRPDNFDENGDPLSDSLIVNSAVLDSIKQMIVDAKAWRFKDSYSPLMETKDGYSWSYSASFAATDSLLAVTLPEQRPRLLRNGALRLSSGGENSFPDTKLFEQVRLYLQTLYESEKIK